MEAKDNQMIYFKVLKENVYLVKTSFKYKG